MTDMTRPYDGGPAFPVHGGHHPDDDPRNHTLGGGMTLRDWFAGQALAGIAANADWWACATDDQVARQAYLIADEMLAEMDGRP